MIIHTHSTLLALLSVFGFIGFGFAMLVNKVLGDPIGKLGGIVGGKWKGAFYWLRGWVKPSQKGTVKDNQAYLVGTQRTMSYKQMNIRNIVRALGYVGRMNLTTWMDLIWQDYCNRHTLALSGYNLFMKNNIAALFASMSSKTIIWNETSNKLNLLLMKVSKGDLEGATEITTAIYTTGTGALVLTFPSAVFGNGLATDLVYGMVAKKAILDTTTWEPKLFVFPPTRGNTKTRTDATITLTLPAGLSATDLTAYLFFRDAAGTIGFSESVSKICAAT